MNMPGNKDNIFIPLAIAREILLQSAAPTASEEIPLASSLGRITAAEIKAPLPMPNFRKSPFDGYCLNSIDTAGASPEAPCILPVRGVIKAGDPISHLPAAAYKIMTGAEVPAFCDCVAKKEVTDRGHDEVRIFESHQPGQNIISVGEDVSAGDIVIAQGKKLTPGAIAMLSSLGISTVAVCKRPRVALLTTGNEIVEPGSLLTPGMVFNSNRYALMAYLEEAGVQGEYLGNASDGLVETASLLSRAIGTYDLILTTGGVSVGDYDFISAAYEALDIERLFWGVQMKPGTPVMAGRKERTIVLSLPGSPAASLIAFEALGSPLLRKMRGSLPHEKTWHTGRIGEDFHKAIDMPRFLRVRAEREEEGYVLYLSGKQNASVLHSMVDYNALALVEALNKPVRKGDLIRFSFNGEDCL